MEIKCIKSAARLLDRNCINKAGKDLFKKVLWVSIGQRVAELWLSKLEVKEEFCRSFRHRRSGFKCQWQGFSIHQGSVSLPNIGTKNIRSVVSVKHFRYSLCNGAKKVLLCIPGGNFTEKRVIFKAHQEYDNLAQSKGTVSKYRAFHCVH